jgi:hypothetical protein
VNINMLTTNYREIVQFLAAIESLGVTVPEDLSAVPRARAVLTEAPAIPNPVRGLVASALAGATAASVGKLLREMALARLTAEEHRNLDRSVEPELLQEFGRRLDAGAADAVLDALRPQFDDAATTLVLSLAKVDISKDPATFLDHASPGELAAWQSLRPAVETLETVAAVVRVLGPTGPFPTVVDPRATDAGLRCGWLDDRGVLCCDGDLMQACRVFQNPHSVNDIRTSPWLRVTARLHSIGSARERVRAWAETAWATDEADHPVGGRMIGDVIVPDEPRANPFIKKAS